ncbi:MAG TPA: helix-turn-helix transcriptional regulator [Clostridiales bacterium]|nr:helix-turn-helix transcriptional regulator [Clostridiales bacterium]
MAGINPYQHITNPCFGAISLFEPEPLLLDENGNKWLQTGSMEESFVWICIYGGGSSMLDSSAVRLLSDQLGGGILEQTKLSLPVQTHCYQVALVSCLALLLVSPDFAHTEENEKKLEQACEEMVGALEERIGLPLCASISPLFAPGDCVRNACTVALNFADYARFVEGKSRIIHEKEYFRLKEDVLARNPDYKLPNFERPMITAILNHNFAHAEMVIHRFITSNLLDDLELFAGWRGNMFYLVNLSMALTLTDISGVADKDRRFALIQERVQTCRTRTELEHHFHELFLILENYIQKKSEFTDYDPKMKRIHEYIDQNFRDPLFGAATICEAFHISQSHLSRSFREQMGVNLSSYIQTLRLNEAKLLLAKTDETVEDIAIHVGYSSAQVLSRLFKKLEGISPSGYRVLSMGVSMNTLT